jgi:hypothetical protein
MTSPLETKPPPDETQADQFRLSKAGRFFAGYAWLILKNLLGWALILVSPAVGFTLPGPAGFRSFLSDLPSSRFPVSENLLRACCADERSTLA